jgi:hypothetical protein
MGARTEASRRYREKYREILAERNKRYREANKDIIKKKKKAYYDCNKEIILEKQRKAYRENPEKRHAILERAARYRKSHGMNKEWYRKWINKRRKENPSVRIRDSISARINSALKGEGKTYTTTYYLGCSAEYLKEYLESQFFGGMSWANYGEWHIDHIRPCCSFDLTNREEQLKCFHYTNLQPLWAADNIRKGAKYILQQV